MLDDKVKENFLMRLIKKFYDQGDDYSVFKNKKGNWDFGYSNDYPMQHGSGKSFQLPDTMVNQLVEERKDMLEALKECLMHFEAYAEIVQGQNNAPDWLIKKVRKIIKNATE